MRTDKQSEASRINGARSTGPVTLEGKQTSSLNGNRHNLTGGRIICLTTEDAERFQQHRNAYISRFQPIDAVELDLVEKILNAAWREQRIAGMEAAFMELERKRQSARNKREFDRLDTETQHLVAFLGYQNQATAITLLQRYSAMARRAYTSALKALKDLQGERFNRRPSATTQSSATPCRIIPIQDAQELEKSKIQSEPETQIDFPTDDVNNITHSSFVNVNPEFLLTTTDVCGYPRQAGGTHDDCQ